jgi:hypothetical protein
MRFANCANAISLALIVCLGEGALATESRFAAYQGAWLADGVACDDVYSGGRNGMTFKSPPDLFVPAFIIRGDRIRTPFAICRISSIKRIGDRDRLVLGCVNPVTSTGASALLGMGSDGRLKRYFNDDDQSGSAYGRCQK